MKRLMARFAVMTALLLSPLALTVPAHAATTADQAAAICGSGYYVQDSETMGYGQDVIAYLLYNASSGNNCAVTLKTTANPYYGQPTGLGAGVIKTGGSWIKDDKAYSYYAGPVYVRAPGACVQFWGHDEEIGASTIHQWYYTSPWEFCG
jgi:hypothetical protein